MTAGICLLVVAVGQSVWAQPTDPPVDRLAQTIADTVQADAFDGAAWGIHVLNLRSGEVLYARNATQSFIPASNAKLLTTAAALDRLGPSYRYQTRLYADGPVRDGVLRGNLVVRGDGDPTLGGYQQRNDPTSVFRSWADSLERRGIRRIAGHVVGDDNVHADTPYGHGWSWEDLSQGYGAPLGGLVFNENKVDLTVRGQSAGQPARINWVPFNTDYVTVVNQTRTVPHGVEDDDVYLRRLGTNTVHVRSKIHPRVVEDGTVAIHNPTRYFTHTLRSVLLRQGFAVQGRATDLDTGGLTPRYSSDSLRQVASYTSPPLARIVRTLNHESRNLYAEQLLRTIGVEAPPDTTLNAESGSSALGAAAVEVSLAQAGVDTSVVEVADGSGLSRQNLVSPRALVRVLQHMWNHDGPAQSAFYESLPRGGEEGTLQYRLRQPPVAGRVRAKTGTLTAVSVLSGYVTSSRGTPIAFSLLCNNHHADTEQVRSAQDVIVNALARLPL